MPKKSNPDQSPIPISSNEPSPKPSSSPVNKTSNEITEDEKKDLFLKEVSEDRGKIRLLFYKTLKANNYDAKLTSEELSEIVVDLESRIYAQFTGDSYMNQCRTIKFHLSKNYEICFSLLSGRLPARVISSYSANDFLTDAQKKENEKYRDYLTDSAIADPEELRRRIIQKNGGKSEGLLEVFIIIL